MLSALPPAALARVRFPLGDLTKDQVRELARAGGLPVADKRESQDLCFLAGTSRERFLARHGGLHDSPGDVVDRSGRVLGRHEGHHNYTVGQRRGLGIATPDCRWPTSARARTSASSPGSAAAPSYSATADRASALRARSWTGRAGC